MSSQKVILVLFLLVVAGCSPKVQSPATQQPAQKETKKNQPEQEQVSDAARPGWVRKRPIDSDYYIGIGIATITPGDRNYKERAKKDALQELCSQIEVQLNSNSYLVTINRDYKFQQDYLTASKASVNTNIEGYRIIDEYENDKEYWIYLSLSRSEYQEAKQRKLNNAANTSLAFYTQAETFAGSYHYPSAILFYAKALAAMKNYLNEAVEVEYKGQNIQLVNACYNNLQQLLNQCQLKFDETELTAKFGLPLDKRIGISAVSTDASKAKLNDIPVRLGFSSGKGQINYLVTTNEKGRAMLILSKITSSQNYQEIQATLDLEKICSSDTSWKDIKPFIDRITRPSVSLLIHAVPPRFFSSSTEKNLDVALAEPSLRKVIDKKLFEAGLELTMSRNEADWIIELDANTTRAGESYGMITCLLHYNLSVKAKGVPVYLSTRSDIKGIRLKNEEAGMEAYKNAGAHLEENVVPELYKLLFN